MSILDDGSTKISTDYWYKNALKGSLSLFKSSWDCLLTWQSRVSNRQHLAELPDRLLRDMAMTRADAEQEARKPFWRV